MGVCNTGKREMSPELVQQIVYGAVLLFLLGAVAALWTRMASVQQQIGEVRGEIGEVRGEIREVKGRVDSLQTEVVVLREAVNELRVSQSDIKETLAQVQLQMQRNHYQLMMAILSHSHRPDGRPTFDLPPDFEPTQTDSGE
jgi:septal ring factor EnvC (AmiA/AmiB activator)